MKAIPKNAIHSQFHNDFHEFIIPKLGDFMNNKQKSNKTEMKKEIHFWELPDSIRIKLNRDYHKLLFRKLLSYSNHGKTAKRLNISNSHVYHLKNRRYSLKPSQLVTISKILCEDPETIEESIESINTTRGGTARFKFPIIGNEEIASLVGHCYGDGSIFTKKSQFKFCNFNKTSLNEVKKTVKKQFNTKSINETETTATYSSLVGEILNKFGAHRGHKLRLNEDVPQWIKDGNDKIKSRFLRALIDDDGSVSSSKNNKNINFHQIVLEEYDVHSKRFLKSVSDMLKDFNIEVHGPYLSRNYKVDGKTRNINYILISDWESIKNYSDKINFCHSKKKLKLKNVLNRKKALSKIERKSIYDEILKVFEQNQNPISTRFISKELDIPHRPVLKRLKKLQNDRLITCAGRISNRSFLWNMHGGESKSQNAKI